MLSNGTGALFEFYLKEHIEKIFYFGSKYGNYSISHLDIEENWYGIK